MSGVILDLCGGSGAWSEPYRKAGYDVRIVDPKVPPGIDVRLRGFSEIPIHGILAAPPCTTFAGSGARWWEEKGEADLLEGLSVVDACLRFVTVHRPRWWALENPVGRLRRWLGPPAFAFDPCDYGDGYSKRTLLWGHFKPPLPVVAPIVPTGPNPIHHMAPGPERAAKRSVTSAAFAQAFFEVNP